MTIVASVRGGSSAARHGLKMGDRIHSIITPKRHLQTSDAASMLVEFRNGPQVKRILKDLLSTNLNQLIDFASNTFCRSNKRSFGSMPKLCHPLYYSRYGSGWLSLNRDKIELTSLSLRLIPISKLNHLHHLAWDYNQQTWAFLSPVSSLDQLEIFLAIGLAIRYCR